MARTLPPSRNTTSTTTVDYGGLSPIDAYMESADRPLAYFEATHTTCLATASASIPVVYAQATLTSGMSGNISASAGYFKTHVGGTAVGAIKSLCAIVQVDTGFTPYSTDGYSSLGVISPISSIVRCHPTGTLTLAGSQVVFGLHAQYLAGTGTTAPTSLFFARLNTTSIVTALFYGDSELGSGWVSATKTTACGSLPLLFLHGAGYHEALYVNLYKAA